MIALACGEPPQGRVSWTLRLLADRLVECEIVESIHPETVRKTLKKTNSSLGFKSAGASRPRATPSSSVVDMEDLLEVYQRQFWDNEVLRAWTKPANSR